MGYDNNGRKIEAEKKGGGRSTKKGRAGVTSTNNLGEDSPSTEATFCGENSRTSALKVRLEFQSECLHVELKFVASSQNLLFASIYTSSTFKTKMSATFSSIGCDKRHNRFHD